MIPLLLLAVALPKIYESPADVQGFTKVPPPGVQYRMNEARATSTPWVNHNGWRFARGLNKAFYAGMPEGAAALAAAEAFAYGVEAIIQPDPEDKASLQSMLDFLKTVDAPPMPGLANIGVIDDGSAVSGEVMNLLSRRNLLYRIVAKPDPKLAVNVSPVKENMSNPAEAAAIIRSKLSDDKRLLRVYGSEVVIARLTGEAGKARLHLLNYGRRPVQDVRVRVLGAWSVVRPQVADLEPFPDATEFTVKQVDPYTVVDLQSPKSFTSTRSTSDFDLTADPSAKPWRAARPVQITQNALNERLPGPPTEVRSHWTDKYLYLFYICPYGELNLKPNPQTTSDTDKLWDWDVAEAFIGSEFDHIGHYKEFQVSPQGEWVDLDIDRDHPDQALGEAWNSGYVVKARVDRHRKIWYGEMRIPFSALGVAAPKRGAELRIGLYRCAGRAPNRALYAWSPTGQRNFHVPRAFGTLRLE